MEASFYLPDAFVTRHANCGCPVDLTPRNIALGLSKRLDHLSEKQIRRMFPIEKQKIKRRTEDNPESESRAPKYAVQAINLGRLPSTYLSNKLYILDFDQAYSSQNPPCSLLGIAPRYLAPESIFELRNGPPADIWALGCLIFRIRCGSDIYQEHPETPRSAVARMYGVLGGHLLEHWKTVPFDNYGWPVHNGRQEGVKYRDFSGDYVLPYTSLWMDVIKTVDPKRPEAVDNEAGISNLSSYLPTEAFH